MLEERAIEYSPTNFIWVYFEDEGYGKPLWYIHSMYSEAEMKVFNLNNDKGFKSFENIKKYVLTQIKKEIKLMSKVIDI